MNIHDFWPTETPVFDHTSLGISEVFSEMMEMRRKTFTAYLEIESSKGFIKAAHLRTSQGQEILRLLGFRILEELCESAMAEADAHRKEELIDAFNYLYSITFIDEEIPGVGWEIDIFTESLILLEAQNHWNCTTPLEVEMGKITMSLCGSLADTLRNRAWMNHPQDLYWSGLPELERFFRDLTEIILCRFSSFNEFWSYFVAKNGVLRFRLESNY